MKVSVYDAKSKLSQMINRALDGEEVIVTRNGSDIVKLVPARPSQKWIGLFAGQGEVRQEFFERETDQER